MGTASHKILQFIVMSEKLCLKWSDFQANASTAFASLREGGDFADVTLACEDGEQVDAHKVILSASSTFFQNLLRRNKHPHPLIYMKGMKSEELVAVVDFIYYGEANVYQENIDSFLEVAQELSLKGLTGNGQGNETAEENKPNEDFYPPYKAALPAKEVRNINNKSETNKSIERSKNIVDPMQDFKVERSVTLPYDFNHADLDEQINSMMSKGTNMIPDGPNRTITATVCNICGKEGKGFNIRVHIEAKHLEGVSVPCNICKKVFRSRHSLGMHKKRFH